MVKSIIKRIIVGVGIALCLMALKHGGLIANVHAESNSTMTPNQMSFQTGGSSPVVVPVSAFTYSFYPYMTFYGYTNISDNTWNYAGWTFWSRRTGDYDLSFMYEGAWDTNTNDALSFSISQGSTVYPCTNTAISVQNGRANRSIISVFCPNVSLASADFTINMAIPTSKLLTGSDIGITPLNLYEKGTTTIQNEVAKATEQIKQTNDTIKDESDPNTSGFLQDINQDYSNNPVSDLITMPITFLQTLNNNVGGSCITWNLGTLLGTNLTMPCIDLQQRLGSNLYNLIDMAICLFLAYNIGLMCVTIWNNMTSLKDDFDDMYIPKQSIRPSSE